MVDLSHSFFVNVYQAGLVGYIPQAPVTSASSHFSAEDCTRVCSKSHQRHDMDSLGAVPNINTSIYTWMSQIPVGWLMKIEGFEGLPL